MDILKEGKKRYRTLKSDYAGASLDLLRNLVIELPTLTDPVDRLIGIDVLSRAWLSLQAKTNYIGHIKAPGAGKMLMEGMGIPCLDKLRDRITSYDVSKVERPYGHFIQL